MIQLDGRCTIDAKIPAQHSELHMVRAPLEHNDYWLHHSIAEPLTSRHESRINHHSMVLVRTAGLALRTRMQTATSETESKSRDLSICVHHYTLRAPCPKGQGIVTVRSRPSEVCLGMHLTLGDRPRRGCFFVHGLLTPVNRSPSPTLGEALSRRRAVVHVIGHKLQHNSVKRA